MAHGNDVERYLDRAVERRLMAVDVEFISHPGVLVERDGLHIHHRRDGDVVTVVSGEELSALRERLARFDCVMSATGGLQSGNISVFSKTDVDSGDFARIM